MIRILLMIALISAFPVGYFLAYLCKDELVSGRKYFVLLAIISLLASFMIAFLNFKEKLLIILTLFYVSIASLISCWKSYDKRFVK